jgi:hypothetical protein
MISDTSTKNDAHTAAGVELHQTFDAMLEQLEATYDADA